MQLVSWVLHGRTDVEAETPILWPPDAESWLIGKDPDAGRDWGQEEKGTTEDEMAGWHHRLDGHEFEETPGVGDGQGGLACCSPWSCKESDMTERLNWTELNTSVVRSQTSWDCLLEGHWKGQTIPGNRNLNKKGRKRRILQPSFHSLREVERKGS